MNGMNVDKQFKPSATSWHVVEVNKDFRDVGVTGGRTFVL